MNRIYRIVFNYALGIWQCVSECARAQGKGSKPRRKLSSIMLIGLLSFGKTAWAVDYTTDTIISHPNDLNGATHTISNGSIVDFNSYALPLTVDNANVKITDGSLKSVARLSVGDISGNSGSVQLSDNNALIEAESMYIGNNGNGDVNVSAGTIKTTRILIIGSESGSIGTVNLTGLNSKIESNYYTTIGNDGTGTLNLTNQSSIDSKRIDIGNTSNGKGIMTVSDNAKITSDILVVGVKGNGFLEIKNSQNNVIDQLSISNSKDSIGKVVLEESSLKASSRLGVGWFSKGELTLDKSNLETNFLVSGVFNDSSGSIDSKDSAINAEEVSIGFGSGSHGTLNSLNTTINSTDFEIGGSRNSTGIVSISDDSTINTSKTMAIGSYGKGTLNVKQSTINNENTIISDKSGSNGTFNLIDNSTLTNNGYIHIANQESAAGTFNITNSKLDINKYLLVGNEGDGKLDTNNADMTINSGLLLAYSNTSTGMVNTSASTLNVSEISIGISGKGQFNVFDNSEINTGTLFLAKKQDAQAEMNISSSNITARKDVVVGGSGKASMNIKDDSRLNSPILIAGDEETGVGTIRTENAELNISTEAAIGYKGFGELHADNSKINSQQFDVASGSGTGKVSLNNQSILAVQDIIHIGREGNGTLSGRDSSIEAKRTIIAHETGTNADLSLNNSQLNSETFILVGNQGTGKLSADNSVMTSKYMMIGYEQGSQGEVKLNNNSRATLTDVVSVGSYGEGTLNVKNSAINAKVVNIGEKAKGLAQFSDAASLNAETLFIGFESTSSGELTMIGDNTLLDASDITFGKGSKAHLNLHQGASASTENIFKTDSTANDTKLSLDNATLRLTADQNELFKNFSDNDKIELNTGGATFETDHTVKIVDTARISGSGNLIKSGSGTLSLNIDNKAYTGKTTIADGALNIQADHDAAFTTPIDGSGNLIKSGSGTLSLNIDNKAYTGKTTIADGALNIQADHDAAFTTPIDGSGNLIKSGSGTLTLNSSSKQWLGETHIDEGRLKLIGDYAMRGDEVLAIALHGTGNDEKGQLSVEGNAHLGGTLKIKASDVIKGLIHGGNFNQEWFNVVETTGTRSGEFAHLAIVDTSGAAIDNSGITADYSDNKAVHLKARPVLVDGFVDAVKADNKPALLPIADALDGMSTASSLGQVLNLGSAGLSDAQKAQGIAELSPMGANPWLIANQQHHMQIAVDRRDIDRERHIWAKGIVGASRLKADNSGYLGYDAKDRGIVIGADMPINDGNLGLVLAYVKSDADSLGLARQHIETKSYQLMLYGDYDFADFSVHGKLGLGRSNIEGSRHINTLTAGNPVVAKSDYDANAFQAQLELRRSFAVGKGSITPFAALHYADISSDAYQESGAGVFNLGVGKARYRDFSPSVGVYINQAINPQFAITGSLSAALHTGDRSFDSRAHFIGTDNSDFAMQGQKLGKGSLNAGIGLSYQTGANSSLHLDYQGKWRGDYHNQGVNLGFKMKF